MDNIQQTFSKNLEYFRAAAVPEPGSGREINKEDSSSNIDLGRLNVSAWLQTLMAYSSPTGSMTNKSPMSPGAETLIASPPAAHQCTPSFNNNYPKTDSGAPISTLDQNDQPEDLSIKKGNPNMSDRQVSNLEENLIQAEIDETKATTGSIPEHADILNQLVLPSNPQRPTTLSLSVNKNVITASASRFIQRLIRRQLRDFRSRNMQIQGQSGSPHIPDQTSPLVGRQVINPQTGKRRVQCNICMKTYCDKGALKIHFSAVHKREMHPCTVPGCPRVFSSRRSRNRHSANSSKKLHDPRYTRNCRTAPDQPTPEGCTPEMMHSGSMMSKYVSSVFNPLKPNEGHESLKNEETFADGGGSHSGESMSPRSTVSGSERPKREKGLPLPFRMNTSYYETEDDISSKPAKIPRLEVPISNSSSTPVDPLSGLEFMTEKLLHRDGSAVEAVSPALSSISSVEASESNEPQREQNSIRTEAGAVPNEKSPTTPPYSLWSAESLISKKQETTSSNSSTEMRQEASNFEASATTATGNLKSVFSTDSMRMSFLSHPFGYAITNPLTSQIPRQAVNQAASPHFSGPICQKFGQLRSGKISVTSCKTPSGMVQIPVDEENPRKCVQCGKLFQNHFSVKTHYQNVHLKVMHQCTVAGCQASFPSKRSRDRHSGNADLHHKLLSTHAAAAVATRFFGPTGPGRHKVTGSTPSDAGFNFTHVAGNDLLHQKLLPTATGGSNRINGFSGETDPFGQTETDSDIHGVGDSSGGRTSLQKTATGLNQNHTPPGSQIVPQMNNFSNLYLPLAANPQFAFPEIGPKQRNLISPGKILSPATPAQHLFYGLNPAMMAQFSCFSPFWSQCPTIPRPPLAKSRYEPRKLEQSGQIDQTVQSDTPTNREVTQ